MSSNQSVEKPASAELHPGPGFRLRRPSVHPAPETVAGFTEFASADVSDLLNRLYTMSAAIKNQTDPSLRLIGPACTVKVFPGDNLMVHKSLDLAAPGDVIVVDAGGSPMNGVLGDLVSTKARHRGIAGFVVDGLIRDLPRIRALGDFPVFARGTTPIGPLHRGPGEVNYPISAGGIVVHAGDIIVADLDGVVVVPSDVADSLLQRLRDQRSAQAAYLAAIERGDFSNAWVDGLLTAAGVPAEEDA
jgi:regulator of RNase E activity RraA